MEQDKLLVGAIDMHQHLGPSVIPRALDAIDGAKEAEAAGMKAIVVKDHQFPSMATAALAKKALGPDSSLIVASSIALNHEMGGLNVAAVETAINMGVKVVWMPTISTENHHVAHERDGLTFPASKKKIETLPRPFIPILNEEGQLTDDIVKVLSVIAKDESVVLGAGHGNAAEIDSIIKKALELGIKRIIVNHPTYMIDASIDQMKEWVSKGVYLEFGACTCDPISTICNVDIDVTVDNMRQVGVEHIILSSDYGQVNNPRPVEGLRHFANLLLEKGFTTEELEIMMKINPSKLMGI
jgi:hypothetical protein